MVRRLRPLQLDDLDRLPPGCSGCAFWESAGERERRCGATQDLELQRAWFRRVTDEWGVCGRVAYEDEEVLGFVKYAPSGYFPQAATFSAAPEDPTVPLISCLHISPDARHRGLGTVLLRACLRDLVQRGERRVEAFGHTLDAVNIDDIPMLGMPFLIRNGFTVSRPDVTYPLMKLDLRRLAVVRDDLEAVLDSLRFPLRVPLEGAGVTLGGKVIPGMADLPRKEGSRERVRTFLETHGLAGEIVEFDKSTKTAAEAADAMGCELGQIVKSLVVVVDGDRPAVALVAGDRRGDLDAIATELGGGKAKMADADTVRSATGYAIGGVSPFALPDSLPVLFDDSLMRYEIVYPAAGTPASMVRVERDVLVAMSRARVARVSH